MTEETGSRQQALGQQGQAVRWGLRVSDVLMDREVLSLLHSQKQPYCDPNKTERLAHTRYPHPTEVLGTTCQNKQIQGITAVEETRVHSCAGICARQSGLPSK